MIVEAEGSAPWFNRETSAAEQGNQNSGISADDLIRQYLSGGGDSSQLDYLAGTNGYVGRLNELTRNLYEGVGSGKYSLKNIDQIIFPGSDNKSLDRSEWEMMTPEVRAWAAANPAAFSQSLLAHRNPANQDLASVGAEGGIASLADIRPGGDYSATKYLDIHDEGLFDDIGGLGTVLALAALAYGMYVPGLTEGAVAGTGAGAMSAAEAAAAFGWSDAATAGMAGLADGFGAGALAAGAGSAGAITAADMASWGLTDSALFPGAMEWSGSELAGAGGFADWGLGGSGSWGEAGADMAGWGTEGSALFPGGDEFGGSFLSQIGDAVSGYAKDGIGSFLPKGGGWDTARDVLKIAQPIASIGSGLYGMSQAEEMKKRAAQLAQRADPWGQSGGRALADTQLQSLMRDPRQLSANDPAYKLRMQAAMRAAAPMGQDSGAMSVAAANASTDWLNQRMSTLGGLAGTGQSPGAGGALELQGLQSGANLAGQGLASIGYGLAGAGKPNNDLLQQLALLMSRS